MVRLARSGDAPNGVDDLGLVLLTHLHPDHCADLVPLLFTLHSVIPKSTDPFFLYGPVGLADYLNRLREIYGSWLEPRKRSLELSELQPGESVLLPGGGQVESFAARHPQDHLSREALGYRFLDAGGHSAVFSGDTEPCPGLEKAARGTDLLVVECSTPDELATPGHMTPTLIGELCAAANPRQVVLTHQYPAAAALDLAALVRRIHDCPVHQARDGSIFTVPADKTIDPAPEKHGDDKETR